MKNKSKVLEYINMALNIWRSKVTNPNHPDLLRVSMLALIFAKEINKETEERQEKIKNDKIMQKEDAYDDSFITPLNLSKLLSAKYKADQEVNRDIKHDNGQENHPSESNNSYSRIISEPRNTSHILKDGFDNVMGLFKIEDKGNANSYIVTFILSLTENQLEVLNHNMNLINPGPRTTIQEIDLDFKNQLKPFQYELFKKSRIWTIPKDNYLILNKENSRLSPELRKRLLLNSEITPGNLLIIENSPHYDQELLAREQEEDEKFLDMMRQKTGSEMLKFLLPEQLRIFENIILYKYPLKYFTNTIKESQVDAFKQEINASFQSNQVYSNEDDYFKEGEQANSYFEDEDDEVNPQEYADAIIQGINSIQTLEVFTYLDFGIDYPPDYFQVRELDELKEDFISFVNKLTPSQVRQIYKKNPILTSESMMNSLLNKQSFGNEMSQESQHELFLDNQSKEESKNDLTEGEEEELQDKFKYFDEKNISTDKIKIQDREEPSESFHPLTRANPKTISSIGKFTNTEGDDHENLFEDLNRELNPDHHPATPTKRY